MRHPECVGCAECVEVCPEKDCLTLKAPKITVTSLYAFAIAVVGLFAIFWAVAVFTGNWRTEIHPEVFKSLYPAAASVAHP